MKKSILFAIVCLFSFIISVNAGSYYRDENGLFWLCEYDEGPCFSIKPGQAGANFDLINETITFDDEDYYFDEWLQEEYDETLIGVSKMFYYEKDGKYVLCDDRKTCRSFTFDELVKKGAQINYQESITFWDSEDRFFEGKEYYYNDVIPGDSPSGGPGEGSEGTDGESIPNETPIEKPNYTAKTDYCTRIKEPLQFLGNIVFIIKIVIPIVIIIFGILDFFKAITGAKDDEIKKSARSFAFRCAAGIIIFFIPTIVSLVFSLISSFADVRGDFDACQKCIFRVSECK